MVAAAPLGRAGFTGLVVIYELATTATMIGLVLPARSAANVMVRGRWMHQYGDAVAGALIAVVGITVVLLGW